MSSAQAVSPMEDGEEEEEHQQVYLAETACHPSAPFSELFDMPTTVDPSHIISLIRKLLPHNVKNGYHFHGENNGDTFIPGPESVAAEEISASISSPIVHCCTNNETNGIDSLDDTSELAHNLERSEKLCDRSIGGRTSAEEESWEESGCILWDLAANKTHAEFMVENLLLDVLLASLSVSQSVRVTEITLGILANLLCHEVPRNRILSMQGLINTVVDQLFLDDSLCLCEACRLLTLGLQSSGSVTWAIALQPEHILCRILWIAENTLNSQLLEKTLGLLLATVDGQKEVADVLLPPLMKFDLANLLVSLLMCEVNQLTGERIPDRYPVLDTVLRVIEALSTIDDYSGTVSSNKQLLPLLCDLLKLPEKNEVSSSCVTAVVLIANILTDEPDLASEVSQDLALLQGLLDIIPFVSDDLEAWSALWSVLGKMLVRVHEDEMNPRSLRQYVSVLVEKSDILEEDLIDHPQKKSNEDHHGSDSSGTRRIARTTSLCRIVSILQKWTEVRDKSEKDSIREDYEDDKEVERLLQICCKYTM